MCNLLRISSLTVFITATIITVASVDRNSLGVMCLKCICETISSCNASYGCTGQACGPFQLTKPFWLDAGKLTIASDNPDSPEAFNHCASNPVCAAKTVYSYMKINKKDCNDDGDVDCIDISLIHKFGLEKTDCSQNLHPTFKNSLCSCLRKFEKPENIPSSCGSPSSI
ncbi:lysozyme 2-like [Lycorma delicatula]|uniref:lysozyme 2-like n=1 Tax=Lycorma delicatula TaxID=130591 RepID=UPI003F513490